MSIETIKEAAENFHDEGQSFIIVGPAPDGQIALSYQGDRRQLTAMFRYIRDTLRSEEGIGNHPNRRDVRTTH